MSSLEQLVDLLSVLSDPKKFKAQLDQLREAMAGADAAKKALADLEVAKLQAKDEIDAAQHKHDLATAETDKRLAARLNEIEAREKRAVQLQAQAEADAKSAKDKLADAHARYQRAFG